MNKKGKSELKGIIHVKCLSIFILGMLNTKNEMHSFSLKYDSMARKIFKEYKNARRYEGWSGEVDPILGQHEELLFTKVRVGGIQ